ncbi:type VI immunity family protein [Diaphorobacter caeni]|uniref:type VI immunity family protein n=1 Tax=Diaphorobacter caeni TaxID=2784387 RepID=UPI0018905050|nr:type VI immunity family protein [Diaphorobacter caeni]MBF5004463.1 DUF3396 domain-containing protein [Diaphorobacter caeni]
MSEAITTIPELFLDAGCIPLIRPSLRFEIFIPWADGREMLDAYDHTRAALGDALGYVSTGSGRFRKLTSKLDASVKTWFEAPTPYPPKVYSLHLQGVEYGTSAAMLAIDFVARTQPVVTLESLRNWRNPEFHPNLRCSSVSISFPLDHPLAEPDRFVAWLCELEALQGAFISGSAGYGLEAELLNPPSDSNLLVRERVGALLSRYPSLDLAGIWLGTGTQLYRRDLDDPELRERGEPRAFLKRVNWLNFLSEGQVRMLGGLTALRTRLTNPEIGVVELPKGVLIRAGEAPQIGDVTTGNLPAVYREVAAVLRPVRLPKINPSSLLDFRGERAMRWLEAFDIP